MPKDRTKTEAAIDIPLSAFAVETLRELQTLACGSSYLFPAKKMQTRMIPHLSEETLGAALGKHIKPLMKDVPPFTVYDFRRTARTHIAQLGPTPFVAEPVLNHKIPGVAGVCYRHHYFEERRAAMEPWANLLAALEEGWAEYSAFPLKAQGGCSCITSLLRLKGNNRNRCIAHRYGIQ